MGLFCMLVIFFARPRRDFTVNLNVSSFDFRSVELTDFLVDECHLNCDEILIRIYVYLLIIASQTMR